MVVEMGDMHCSTGSSVHGERPGSAYSLTDARTRRPFSDLLPPIARRWHGNCPHRSARERPKGTATILGFVEALIWVFAVIRVLDGLDDPLRTIGFAAGTYLGAIVEEWMALGQAMVRIISPVATNGVATTLRERGFGATVINGNGLEGDVRITFCVVPRKEVLAVTRLITRVNPEAFVTVDSTTSIDLYHRQERTVRR
jgi:uncharacterized protein YebE (UPF0316 family)